MASERPDLIAEIRESADRLLESSSTLLAVHLFAASAEMVWLAVEMLAGYYVGSTARSPSKASVLRFARRYLPDLGREGLKGLALADHRRRPVESWAELLYEAFHGGLLHDGQREAGIHVVDDKQRWMLSLEADGSARLNAIPFQGQLERGAKRYLADLRRDDTLAARAERRSAFLAHPVLVPKAPGTT